MGHLFSSNPSWTPKTQPNNSRAVVWLSFWCLTRPSANTAPIKTKTIRRRRVPPQGWDTRFQSRENQISVPNVFEFWFAARDLGSLRVEWKVKVDQNYQNLVEFFWGDLSLDPLKPRGFDKPQGQGKILWCPRVFLVPSGCENLDESNIKSHKISANLSNISQ